MTQYMEYLYDQAHNQRETITVVVPTIAPRRWLLARALDSVVTQTVHPVAEVSVEVAEDIRREGAAATRNRALSQVDSRWVAFLDDDDEFMPRHLERLLAHALSTEADYVYSWFMIKDPTGAERPDLDPFPGQFGKPFDPEHPVQTTVTTLVRTELAKDVGIRPSETAPPTPDGHRAGEDWQFTLDCLKAGAVISHLPERTWWWHHHGANTSGLPDRW